LGQCRPSEPGPCCLAGEASHHPDPQACLRFPLRHIPRPPRLPARAPAARVVLHMSWYMPPHGIHAYLLRSSLAARFLPPICENSFNSNEGPRTTDPLGCTPVEHRAADTRAVGPGRSALLGFGLGSPVRHMQQAGRFPLGFFAVVIAARGTLHGGVASELGGRGDVGAGVQEIADKGAADVVWAEAPHAGLEVALARAATDPPDDGSG